MGTTVGSKKMNSTLEPSWPTVAIRLSRAKESEGSLFKQIEQACPLGRGQRGLLLAPSFAEVEGFLDELCERINRLNPGLCARLIRSTSEGELAILEEALAAGQKSIREGRHSVIILHSLNASIAASPKALAVCKRLFGSAQATCGGGTFTVLAVALDTPVTDLDRLVLKSFRGTGNMELALCTSARKRTIRLDRARSGTKHGERIRLQA